MAITLSIYSNTYNTTKTVSIDFLTEVATISTDTASDANNRYFFKFSTSARDTSNLTYGPRIVEDLSDLALNDTKQSAHDDATAYANVKSMIVDYLYDYINGHTADQFSSGCTSKAPMKFST